MSDHYRRQVQQLEALLARKLQEVDLLEKQHQVLQLKESALQSAIGALEGSLTCLTQTLDGSMPSPDATAAAGAAAPTSAAATAVPAPAAHLMAQSSKLANSTGCPTQSCSYSGASSGPSTGASSGLSSGVSSGPTSGASSGATHQQAGQACAMVERSSSDLCSMSADARKTSTGTLQQLLDSEQRVQHVLQQLGGCSSGSSEQLYTTQLLQRALANEARTLYYLNHTKQQRLRGWAQVQTQMALLLRKYDADLPTSRGRARALLDDMVDDFCGRFVASLLYQTPDPHLAVLMTNVQTLEFEHYPAGWWDHVVQGVELSPGQATSLKHVWGRAKVKLQKLTQECDQLLGQLRQLQQQQLQGIASFGQTLEQLPCLQRTQALASTSRKQRQQQLPPQQQQQQTPAHTAHQQQQQQTPAHTAHQQQQQQQQTPAHTAHQQQQQQQTPAHTAHQQQQQQQQQQTPAHTTHQQQQQQQQTPAHTAHQQQQQQHLSAALPDCMVALQLLHTAWQHEQTLASAAGQAARAAVGSEAVGDELIAELVTDLEKQHFQAQAGQQAAHTSHQQQQATSQVCAAGACAPEASLAVAALPDASAGLTAVVPPLPCSPLFLPSIGGAQHPAAAAAAAGMEGQPGMPPPITGAGGAAVQAASLHPGDVDASSLLWQECTEERLPLERRLRACIDKIKVVYFSLMLHIVNTLTKKQIATMCVHAHPYVCDALSFCEALDSLELEPSA